ncbi:MAG: thioredoxin domain-containing protein [Ardenticatenia bacterium]|nr:thioredoxin domain-containing protein [Ardenticatenia bacterium]
MTISLRLFRRLLSSPLFRIAVLPAPSASTIGASLVNRLSDALSPYLRQHADNPVHWQPWDPQALAAARDSGRPILLSVGYSACHWCHVMAHESFEDQRLAALMNQHFVNIKVDREERPDVDALYMDALQAMTGRGGWPMTVFLTPEGLPFYGGTYFPPEARHGMAGFGEVLTAIAQAWEGRREAVLASAQRLADALRGAAAATGATQGPSPAALNAAAEAVAGAHDPRHGGFGAAPKFPQAPQLAFLAAYGRTFPWRSRRQRRWRSSTKPWMPWPAGGCSTSWAGASIATASMPTGPCRISRRCSMTMPCCCPCTWVRRPAARAGRRGAWLRPRWAGCCARCAIQGAASSPPRTPIKRAGRAAFSSGARRSWWPCWARPTAPGRRSSSVSMQQATSSTARRC